MKIYDRDKVVKQKEEDLRLTYIQPRKTDRRHNIRKETRKQKSQRTNVEKGVTGKNLKVSGDKKEPVEL